MLRCFRLYAAINIETGATSKEEVPQHERHNVTGKLLRFFIHDLIACHVLARAHARVHRLCTSALVKYINSSSTRRDDAIAEMQDAEGADVRWIEHRGIIFYRSFRRASVIFTLRLPSRNSCPLPFFDAHFISLLFSCPLTSLYFPLSVPSALISIARSRTTFFLSSANNGSREDRMHGY
jgi:hypothetical protein